MNYELQVVTLPVRDVDASLRFYTEQAGFILDVDYRPTNDFRVVQLTPPGSACSIQLGVGLTDATPGSIRTTYLVVTDVEAAYCELSARGIAVSEIRRKTRPENWEGGWETGVEPGRGDYASAIDFADPDGNTWVIQEIGHHKSV